MDMQMPLNFFLFVVLLSAVFGKPHIDDYPDYSYDRPEYMRNGKHSREAASRTKYSIYANKVRWRGTSIANRAFAFKLYSRVASAYPRVNIMISPLVVSTGLSMTLLGAEGTTEKELMTVLEYSSIGRKRNSEPYTKEDVPRLYQSFLHKLNDTSDHEGDTFLIACRLFGEQSETFSPEFVRDTGKYYGAEMELVDFALHPDDARSSINSWVSDMTKGTIPEALPVGTVSSDSLLALASAAYFKGTWLYKFDISKTRPGLFTTSDGSTVTVDFMKASLRVLSRYSEAFKSHIIILPYKAHNSKFSVEMQLFLPISEGEDSLRLIESMSDIDLKRESRNMENITLEVHLPKFRINFGIDLADTLMELGLRSLFGNADLSGMNGKRNLRFTNAMHEGFMEVDEEGTTASASFVSTLDRVARPSAIVFNRPFFFLIREKSSNSILFMGRVENPEQRNI